MRASAIPALGRVTVAATLVYFASSLAFARDAAAVEQQWHVGADLGLSLLDIDDKSTMDIGGGVGVDLTYGITDQFNFVAEVQSSRVAAGTTMDNASTPHTRPTGLSSAAVGVTYVLDVLRWVPYGGVLVGPDLLSGGTLDNPLVLPTAQLAVGLDYQLDRTWSVGVAGRQHIFATHTSTYPSFTTVFARVEYAWGGNSRFELCRTSPTEGRKPMNRALVTSLASLASLLALAALEGTASAQNFGVPPPPAQYSGTYTSTAAPPAYASTAQASARVGQSGSPAADFGNQYNLSIGSDFGFNFGVISQNSGPTTIDFTLLPAVDYFIIQNLSIGGTIGIDYSHTSQDVTDTTTVASHTLDFRIQPRVGYNIPVNQSFSVWPRVGLQFDHLDSGSATTVNNTTTSTGGAGNAFGVAISVPILWHPYEHYYLGLSPNLTAAFVGDGKYTSAGINFVVGGWL